MERAIATALPRAPGPIDKSGTGPARKGGRPGIAGRASRDEGVPKTDVNEIAVVGGRISRESERARVCKPVRFTSLERRGAPLGQWGPEGRNTSGHARSLEGRDAESGAAQEPWAPARPEAEPKDQRAGPGRAGVPGSTGNPCIPAPPNRGGGSVGGPAKV